MRSLGKPKHSPATTFVLQRYMAAVYVFELLLGAIRLGIALTKKIEVFDK